MRFGRNAGVCIADSIAACVLPFLFAFESFGCFLRTTEWTPMSRGPETRSAFPVPCSFWRVSPPRRRAPPRQTWRSGSPRPGRASRPARRSRTHGPGRGRSRGCSGRGAPPRLSRTRGNVRAVGIALPCKEIRPLDRQGFIALRESETSLSSAWTAYPAACAISRVGYRSAPACAEHPASSTAHSASPMTPLHMVLPPFFTKIRRSDCSRPPDCVAGIIPPRPSWARPLPPP